jgi:hypothetical protein
MIGLYFMPVRKYHNETPHFAQLLYANKIIWKTLQVKMDKKCGAKNKSISGLKEQRSGSLRDGALGSGRG